MGLRETLQDPPKNPKNTNGKNNSFPTTNPMVEQKRKRDMARAKPWCPRCLK
jgi:hypothetical protein